MTDIACFYEPKITILAHFFCARVNSYGDVYNVTNSTLDYYLKAPYRDHSPDFQIPFFTVVEFLCYMGWIKVAANLLNPFGDDDEDFKINYLIDRNLQVNQFKLD